jgi:hypothetical protein
MLPTPSMERLSITFSSDRVEMKNVSTAGPLAGMSAATLGE